LAASAEDEFADMMVQYGEQVQSVDDEMK